MAIWTIYNQSGSTVRATVKELEYHGEWMGDEYVSVTVRSAEPVQFSVGDKLEYRGETFEINYDPNLIKRARSKSYGEAFVYENVRLYSQASRLKDVGFKDYVLNWNSQSNTIPYSSQGTFQFFCGSVEDLADRIQANLDRHTNGLWKVFTPNSVRTGQRHNCGSLWSSYYDGTEDTGKTDVNIEADNLSCLDAVNLSYSAFSLSYYVTNATVSGSVKNIIVIGGAPVSAAHNFRYGKDNGLYEIERTSDDSERIVTKLFAYGSDKNLPLNYYANLGKEIHISIYHKSTREIILGQPDLLLWVNKEWSRSLGSAFAPNYSVTLTSGSLTYKVSVTHDHLNGYDNDRGPLVEDVDYMYFRLWSGDAGAQAFYDAVTAGQTFTVTGVSINKMPEEWIYQPPSYNYPALLSISRLMLPGFPGTSLYSWVASHGGTNLNPTTGRATWRGHTAIFSRDARDPWVMSERSATLGVREGTLNFDGSAGEDEVAPTIEGAVDGAGRRLDEVAWAEQMDDSGFLGEDPEEGLLTFGFMPGGDPDYIDWLDNDGDVTISMKDGACVGREFKMKKAEKNGNGDWELTLNRCYDDSLGRYFPYREEGSNTLFQVVGSGNTHGTMEGNHFVILGISMPGGLVEAASIRLLEKALEQLDKKDHQTFTYIPKIDEIYMQRQDDAVKEGRDASTYGTVSLHDTLHAGMQMEIQDTDLDLHYMPFIDVLTIRENGNNGIPTYDVVLRDEKELTMQQRIQSQIEGGTEAAINGVEDAYSSSRYLSKIQDDTAQGFIRFIKGLQVGERFVPGLMGEGGVFRKEADGTTYIEADNLYIRMKAYFDTVEIRKFLHTGGNRIATVAGAKCVRVEWLDSSNNVLVQEQSNLSRAVKFRCFFRANDGDNIVTNDFLVGDQAYCHVTRMQSETMEQASEGTGGSMLTTRHYWRLVIGTNVSDDGGRLTEDGEYWIDLSNYFYNGQPATMTWEAEGVTHNHLSHQAGSDIPMAQDDIVQLGHAYDTTRQGAIVEFVTGGDSPSYQIFQGIDEFSFVGKNYISLGYATGSTNTHGAGHAYMDLYGDVFIGAKPDAVTGESPTYIKYDSENEELTIKAVVEFQSPDDPQTTTTLDDFARLITGDIENIQSQIDGEIDTWFYAGIPTLQNAPANEWTTDAEKEKHTGDLYYDIGTGADAGKAYRFVRSQATPYVYSWQYIDDTAITEALRIAAQAQDTADHKRRVFLAIPTPPYDEGDLWANAVYPANYDGRTDEEHHKYNNDLLRAKKAVPRTEGGQEITTFSINDWELATKYTDDSSLIDFIDNTYTTDKTNLQQQIDGKAETWYQDDDPSSAWTTASEKAKHIGDLWSDTSANGGKKTYIWKDFGTSANPRYAWAEQAVPDEVFDEIDGKSAIYTNTFAAHPVDYSENDLWILPAAMTINGTDYKRGEVLTATRDYSGTNTWQADWTKKVCYTDDSSLTTFLNDTYSTDKANLQTQIDQKAETWYQSTDPSLAWTTPELRTLHVGDLWHNSSNTTVSNIEAGMDAMWNGTSWSPSEVPQDVYDKIDGKADIFVSKPTTYNRNDLWIIESGIAATDIPSGCQVGDIVIADNMPSGTNSRGSYIKGDWRKKDRYTDDSYAHEFDYLKTAMKGDTSIQGGLLLSNTIVLRNLDTSTTPATITDIMSGINGVLNTSLQDPLKSIAAWYGGEMKDYETLTDAQKNQGWSVQKWAKSLFRFDGSGYLASGNITWDAAGIVTIANVYADVNGVSTSLSGSLQTLTNLSNALPLTIVSGTTYLDPQYSFNQISVRGKAVATQEYVSQNYISIAFFNRLFQAYSSTTISDANKVAANDTTTAINNLKLLVGTWANEYLSALGLNSSSSGGGGGDVTWTQLTADNPSTGQQIHPSHLSGVTEPLYFLFNEESSPSITYNGRVNRAVSGILTKLYADGRYYQKIANGSASEVVLADGTSSKLKTINGNSIFGEGDIVISGGGGDLSGYVTTSTAQNISGTKRFSNGCWIIASNERDEITSKYWDNDTLYNNANTAVVSSTVNSIRNALRFRWYDSYWNIGNIRSNSTPTAGFGIALEDTTNNRLIDCLRVTKDGTYVQGNLVWHAGNVGAGSGLDADMIDGKHLSSWIYPTSPRDFADGTLITTNIDYSVTEGDSFYMEISGDTYTNIGSMLTLVQGYIYNNTIINYSVNNLGRTQIGELYAINVSGKLVFWFPRIAYWQSYKVGVYCSRTGNYWENRAISITNSTKPSGTKEINLCANKYTNAYTDSNVASATYATTAGSTNQLNGHTSDYYVSYDNSTQGNDVDFNTLSNFSGKGFVLQPIHVPNYSGQTNYPYFGYGTMVCVGGNGTLFPFRFALYQEIDNEPAKIYVQNSAYGKSNFVGRKWSRILTEDATFTAPNGTCGYATTAGFAQASDVYAWAKASTKPSYNFNEIQDAEDLGVSIGTITRRVLLTRTKTNQGYRSRAAIGLTNVSGEFSPVILSVGTNDGGTSWMDYTFTADGWFYSEKVRSKNVTIWGDEVTNDSKGLFIQASDKSNRAWITWNGNTADTDYLNIHTGWGNINLTPAKNVGIGTTSPSQRLHVEGNIYTNGRASINTTSTTGILNVSRGSTNDYAIDTLGQQRYKYDSGDTSDLSIGLFSSNKCPFIRFTDVLGGYIDVHMVPVVDSGGTVTDSLFSIGKTSHTTRVIARNFRVYTRISSDNSGNTQAMQALMNGRLLVGSADTTLANGNTDCKFLVNGNMCTSAANGSFIKIGNVYLIYDSGNNAIKVAGNAAGTAAANFYATGAVSALGANTSSGGGTTEYVTLSTGQAISGAKTFTANVQMSADIIPSATNQYYVGTSGRTFLGLYVKNATITGVMEVGGITYLCSRAFQFSASTDGGGHTLSVISTNGRSLRIELGSSALNPYVSKPWTEGSDIRRKDIIANASTSVDNVANAPVFNFRYKGDSVNSINLGTSAQYWRNVFPCGVSEMGDGYLAMNYGAIALASAVMVARKVQNHEDRILKLERENEQLRNEIKQLKAA